MWENSPVSAARLWILVVLVGGPIAQALATRSEPAQVSSRLAFSQQDGAPSSDPVDDDGLQTHDDDDDDDLSLGAGEPAALAPVSLCDGARTLRPLEATLFPGSIDREPPLHVPRA
jgi:hypothetical protein